IQRKTRLVIVPDGSLHVLPFDALRDSQNHYLGDGRIITYAPSATVLHLLRTTQPERRATLALLAVGDPVQAGKEEAAAKTRGDERTDSAATRGLFDVSGANMKPLPAVTDEVRSVARIGGQGSVVLLGNDATEAAFKAQPLDRFR